MKSLLIFFSDDHATKGTRSKLLLLPRLIPLPHNLHLISPSTLHHRLFLCRHEPPHQRVLLQRLPSKYPPPRVHAHPRRRHHRRLRHRRQRLRRRVARASSWRDVVSEHVVVWTDGSAETNPSEGVGGYLERSAFPQLVVVVRWFVDARVSRRTCYLRWRRLRDCFPVRGESRHSHCSLVPGFSVWHHSYVTLTHPYLVIRFPSLGLWKEKEKKKEIRILIFWSKEIRIVLFIFLTSKGKQIKELGFINF